MVVHAKHRNILYSCLLKLITILRVILDYGFIQNARTLQFAWYLFRDLKS